MYDNLIFNEGYIHGLLILVKKKKQKQSSKDKKLPFHFLLNFGELKPQPFPLWGLDQIYSVVTRMPGSTDRALNIKLVRNTHFNVHK